MAKKIPFTDDKFRYDESDTPSKASRRNYAALTEANSEDARDMYERYKSKRDPDAATITSRAKAGDIKAFKRLREVVNQGDYAQQAATRAVKADLEKAADPDAAIRGYKKGGAVSSRGDGLAQRGKTKGRFV